MALSKVIERHSHIQSHVVQVVSQIHNNPPLQRQTRVGRNSRLVLVEKVAQCTLEEGFQVVDVRGGKRGRQEALQAFMRPRATRLLSVQVASVRALFVQRTRHSHFSKEPGTRSVSGYLCVHCHFGKIDLQQDLLHGFLIRDPDLAGTKPDNGSVFGMACLNQFPNPACGKQVV